MQVLSHSCDKILITQSYRHMDFIRSLPRSEIKLSPETSDNSLETYRFPIFQCHLINKLSYTKQCPPSLNEPPIALRLIR